MGIDLDRTGRGPDTMTWIKAAMVGVMVSGTILSLLVIPLSVPITRGRELTGVVSNARRWHSCLSACVCPPTVMKEES